MRADILAAIIRKVKDMEHENLICSGERTEAILSQYNRIELCERFGTSDKIIRNHIKTLVDDGVLIRVCVNAYLSNRAKANRVLKVLDEKAKYQKPKRKFYPKLKLIKCG